MHNSPHPGEIIRGLCLEPLGLTVTSAAAALGVSRKTLSAILNGRAGISPEMAVRLSMAFGTSAKSWMTQQAQYDLWHAERRRKEFKVTRLVAEMPPVELYTPERIAEFERETQVDADTEAAVREALRHPTGA